MGHVVCVCSFELRTPFPQTAQRLQVQVSFCCEDEADYCCCEGVVLLLDRFQSRLRAAAPPFDASWSKSCYVVFDRTKTSMRFSWTYCFEFHTRSVVTLVVDCELFFKIIDYLFE